MRRIIICLTFLFTAIITRAQSETPGYKTAIANLKNYYNHNHPDSLEANFDPIMKSSVPIDKISAIFSQMQAQLGPLKQTTFVEYQEKTAAIYKAEYQNDALLIVLSLNTLNQINGLYFKAYTAGTGKPKVTDSPKTTAAASTITDPSVIETPFILSTLAGTLAGTLTMPKDAPGKLPIVLIVPGWGAIDRNGNSAPVNLNCNTFKDIAEALGKAGIASLRYDKRGVGQSTTSGKEIDSKLSDYVDDASALMLKLKEDTRFSKFIVLGHGEGSMTAMLTALNVEHVDAVISAEGGGRTAALVLEEQVKNNEPPSVSTEFNTMIDSLKKGRKVPKVDPALYFIARPTLQPYLISWINIDPIKVIKHIKSPVLVIQGTNDLQIPEDDAVKLKAAKKEVDLKIITGMNHILKDSPADKEKNLATYNDPTLPLQPECAAAMIDFIKKLK